MQKKFIEIFKNHFSQKKINQITKLLIYNFL